MATHGNSTKLIVGNVCWRCAMTVEIRQAANEWHLEVGGVSIGSAESRAEAHVLATHAGAHGHYGRLAPPSLVWTATAAYMSHRSPRKVG
jgi:hypothetical protein